ncbi:cryptochrome/photolyase family protein [Limnobacter humi]|uniref:Cryptochrome/photolyase family protein n=1 Tax=Limnobacter humi TaxID=1778671 RepID=A0ABT1WDU6_9BURK|nr:cryptochrome/photolyase family protein [Limnobacter humi]MCQ8894907.1 cryptochrome/photolyase family protein [Limnobacter humi]
MVTKSALTQIPKHWVLVLGDQLTLDNPALQLGAPADVGVLMIESADESRVVWSHKSRTVLFLSAMRHFAGKLREAGYTVIYNTLTDTAQRSLCEMVFDLCLQHSIRRIDLMEPGEWRLEQGLVDMARQRAVEIRFHDDPHFICSRADFARWAAGYKQLRMEYFYREMRRRTGILMAGAEPEGGQWNFDADNRSAYPKTGPGSIPEPAGFEPDELTLAVMADVERHLPDNPGTFARFGWAVTREQALKALDVFIDHRLRQFGPYQDAMWTDTPFGWHSLLSAAINLHLLNPLEVIQRAEAAYKTGRADLPGVEGFIRQILGWREFMRGVYWMDMPKMRQDNALKADVPLPDWFWTGQTHMACLRDAIGQTLEHAYAHHIQRLMVIGNFALLAGLVPQQVEDWFLAVYVDAVEWVELPNVAGMALFANGGRFTSKPYVASGAYIKRMSNYCGGCRYDPAVKTGDKACPFTTLYWGFLDKHEALLAANPRTGLMAKNIGKLSQAQRIELRGQVARTFEKLQSL